MASSSTAAKLASLPSLRRQHLLAEFAGLKQACPDGVFVSLTPGDPSLWSGVLFVRRGPYATAVLRFQISFPDTFPALPPLVTFSTDMFHPLITPLTTYMYSTDIHDSGTVSATDDERLPPGGFSMRHGFPHWFGRRSRQVSAQSAAASTPPRPGGSTTTTPNSAVSSLSTASPSTLLTAGRHKDVSAYEVLRYLRSAFDDADVLDSIPLEAAGNPGAWHAWRTHRRGVAGKALPATPEPPGAAPAPAPAPVGKSTEATRRPGEWNWEGVWEERTKRGITASISEAVLYGNAGGSDEVINFLNMDEADVEGTKNNLMRTMGAAV